MAINESEFFHEATLRICGSLDMETAMRHCLGIHREGDAGEPDKPSHL